VQLKNKIVNKIREQYNQIYTEHKEVFNEGGPSPIVEDVLKYRHEGRVLDLGAGQGRNALFLARQGFDVKAIDLSEVGIAHISKAAEDEQLALKAEIGDVLAITPGEHFDVIVNTAVLHKLREEQGLGFVQKMKDLTNDGGLNVIAGLTKEGDFYKMPGEPLQFYLNSGQLRELYSGWEILEYRERRVEMLHKNLDGSPTFNVVVMMIARKPQAKY
jgi:tellurite methyltransferase